MVASIIKAEEHFFVTKYVGNGGGQNTGRFVPFTDNGTISKSCVFDDGDTAYLTRTPSSNGNAKKFTISLWFKPSNLGASKDLFGNSANGAASSLFYIMHYSDSTIYVQGNDSGSNLDLSIQTSTTFEDTSKWYHIVVRIDTTQSTDSDRSKIYVDGVEQSLQTTNYPALNAEFGTSQDSRPMVIGRYNYNNTRYLDGHLAEVNFADGQSYGPDTFGITDTSTGRWIPKSLSGITYGTNGFRLEFANSAGQTIGDDTSGQGNDFTVNNLAASDLSTNTPTSNYTKMSTNYHAGATNTISQGGRVMQPATGSDDGTFFDMKFKTGKWYCEFYAHSADAVAQYIQNGIADFEQYVTDGVQEIGRRKHTYAFDPGNGRYFAEGSGVVTGLSPKITQGDIGGIAVDFDNNKIFFSINGTYINSANPANGTGGLAFAPASDTISGYYMLGQSNGTGSTGYNNLVSWNVGDNPTFNGTIAAGAAANTDGFGSTFKYTPPDGFKGLSFDNQPETGKGIPDFMQIKNRDATDRWLWQDTLRGFNEYGSSSSASPGSPIQFNTAITDGVRKTLKGGFQTEDSDFSNSIDEKYVAYNWVANNGVTATDSSGNMDCELQANPTAGFSIAKFTVNGTGVRTWAHGLGAVPEFGHLWVYNTTPYGTTYHHKMSATPAQNYMLMSSSQAVTGFTNGWGASGPSSSLWSGTEGQLFSNGYPYIFYSYVGIPGYSKFDSYVGNGNVDGPFVYLGFKPRFIYIKGTGTISHYVFDSERVKINPNGKRLVYDGTYVEDAGTTEAIDFLSNGFKLRNASGGTNGSGSTYIYGAWAEHPFNGDGENAFATAR